MNTIDYATACIEDFYIEGNTDYLSVKWLMGSIEYSQDDVSYGKRPMKIIEQTLKLLFFLVGSNDFTPCKNVYYDEKGIHFIECENFEEFELLIRTAFEKDGLNSELFMNSYVLNKRFLGKSAPLESEIPPEIVDLFQHVSE